MSELDRLYEVALVVRPPAFEELLETRRRRTRHARLATASTLVVAAIAVAGAVAVSGSNLRTDPSPIAPSPTPAPSPSFEIPVGQQTIASEVGPGDLHGFEVLATVTNSQPAHQDDSELFATVTTQKDAHAISMYCRGASDLFYFYDREDGAGGSGRCSPDADTTLRPDTDLAEVSSQVSGTEQVRMRMWIARPSAAYLDCQLADCNADYGLPPPIVNPDAEFGFRIFEYTSTPALHLFTDLESADPYEALSSLNGEGWLLDRAVLAPADGDRLAFELPVSNSAYLVDVYDIHGPHFDHCVDQHQDVLPDWESTDHSVYEAAVDEVCYATLRLVVDGTPVTPDDRDAADKGHFADLGARLSTGAVHHVEVQVVQGDPRNIRFAVIVRTRTQIPPDTSR